jgi:hypothetical protein
MTFDHWLYWGAAFLIVIALLTIASGIQNEIEDRKERRK